MHPPEPFEVPTHVYEEAAARAGHELEMLDDALIDKLDFARTLSEYEAMMTDLVASDTWYEENAELLREEEDAMERWQAESDYRAITL